MEDLVEAAGDQFVAASRGTTNFLYFWLVNFIYIYIYIYNTDCILTNCIIFIKYYFLDIFLFYYIY
jgi:hypothetical protein